MPSISLHPLLGPTPTTLILRNQRQKAGQYSSKAFAKAISSVAKVTNDVRMSIKTLLSPEWDVFEERPISVGDGALFYYSRCGILLLRNM